METTVTAILQQLGDLFHTFHELFIWMVQLGGDEFRGRVKKIYFLVAAIPCNMRRQLRNYETTRQIFELHGFGLSLLSIDCVNVSTANGNLRINWSSEKILSEPDMKVWDDSLRRVVSGLRYAESEVSLRKTSR